MEGTPWARKVIFGNTYLGGVEQRAAHDPGLIIDRMAFGISPLATESGAESGGAKVGHGSGGIVRPRAE